jgi:antitoxin (DNA-binding transcriptional repressor) of toxin-antitoxin stability system
MPTRDGTDRPGNHNGSTDSPTRDRAVTSGRILMGVTSAHAYELPPHTSAPAEAIDAAEHGQVVYLTRNGEPVAAIVPTNVATAGAAAIEALEDADDVRAARAALADPGPDIPMAEVWADYADILGPYPDAQSR